MAAAAAVEMSVDDDDGDGDEEEEAAAAAAEVEVELEAFPDPQRPVSPDSPTADPEPGLSPPLAGLWEAPWSSKSPPPAARGCGEGRGGRGGESLACGQRRRKAECPRRRSCISFTYAGADGQSKRSRASPVSSRRQQQQQRQQEEEEEEEQEESGELQRLGTSHRGRSKNSPPPLPLSLPPPLPLLPLPLALPLPEVGEGEGGEGVRWGGGDGGYWEQGGEGGREGEVELIADASPPGGAASLEGLAAAASLPDSLGIRDLEPSEDQESYPIESEEDDVPFHDDPKDEMYDPSPHRDRGKQRRRPRKDKPDAVETPEPAKRKIQRPKEDRGPRPPKKRKKPPIQYVRCEVEGCGTILANPRYLQHHMRYQHMLKKKYVCPHPSCGRLFRLQKQLLRHTKHHSDQRDYICEYCARAFKSSHNLAVHRMIHTGEKPLQCEICGFTCRQKASLNWHMKKHDAESGYQFPCGVCGKRFEKKDSVVAHKSKSHPEILIAEALAAGSEG